MQHAGTTAPPFDLRDVRQAADRVRGVVLSERDSESSDDVITRNDWNGPGSLGMTAPGVCSALDLDGATICIETELRGASAVPSQCLRRVQHRGNRVRWTFDARVAAEEPRITADDVDKTARNPDNPEMRRLHAAGRNRGEMNDLSCCRPRSARSRLRSLPIGLVMARGRQSDRVLVKSICIGVIELVVGAAGSPPCPAANTRARPSLGRDHCQSQRLVIMPQALKIAIPDIVNGFRALFRDTTPVSIIGPLDPPGLTVPIRANRDWTGNLWEPRGVIALLFFIVCCGMPKDAPYLERKLRPDRQCGGARRGRLE